MVSLLLAHGHPEARRYPVSMVWQETELVRKRVNRDLANQGIITQLAIASVLSEKGGKAFQKQIKFLTEG